MQRPLGPVARSGKGLFFPPPSESRKSLGVLINSFRVRPAIDKLAFPAGFDQPGINQNAKVVRDDRGRDVAQRDDLTASHFLAGINGFKEAEPRFVP